MRITFSGSPAKVVAQMKEYIARCGIEFGEDPAVELNSERKPISDPLDGFVREHINDPAPYLEQLPSPQATMQKINPYGQFGGEEPFDPKLPPQNTAARVCQFCGRYTSVTTGRMAFHERRCKKNPNRVPDVREGRPLNHGLRKWHDDQKIAKQVVQNQGSAGVPLNETLSTNTSTENSTKDDDEGYF